MKIISQYTNRVLADEDRNYLMSHGIASVVYGDAAPQCLKDYFDCEPISLAVQDEQSARAKEMLISKKNSDITTQVPKWLSGRINGSKAKD